MFSILSKQWHPSLENKNTEHNCFLITVFHHSNQSSQVKKTAGILITGAMLIFRAKSSQLLLCSRIPVSVQTISRTHASRMLKESYR
jgi:hypothetical protein